VTISAAIGTVGSFLTIVPCIQRTLLRHMWGIKLLHMLDTHPEQIPSDFASVYSHAMYEYAANKDRTALSLFRIREVRQAIRGAVSSHDNRLVMSEIDKVTEWSAVGDQWRKKGLDVRQEVEAFVRLYNLAIDQSQTPSEARCETAVVETRNDTSQLTTCMSNMSVKMDQIAAVIVPGNNPDTSMGGSGTRALDLTGCAAGVSGGQLDKATLDWAFQRGRLIGRSESEVHQAPLQGINAGIIDAQILALIRTIKGFIKTLDFDRAERSGEELDAHLSEHAHLLSPDRRKQAYYELSVLWTALAKRRVKNGDHPDFTNAQKYLREARV